ncbi:MAG: hypothetical protein IJI45_18910 [Anaerolineaceae bacterium]|nr:hypothetical protein [Anaerolineaceae bacterium]
MENKPDGDRLIEEGVKTLNIVATKINATKMIEPSFLIALIGASSYAYQYEDSMYVVSITGLKNRQSKLLHYFCLF